MATLLLTAAAAAVPTGTGFFGTLASQALGAAASYTGNIIDQKLLGLDKIPGKEGPRMADLAVQTSTYGKMIPIVYGVCRIAGNIIWSRPIKETATTTTHTVRGGKGGGGGRITQQQTTYSYSATLAIAVCEGPIDDIYRVWADAAPINPKQLTYRLYKGTETQTPDPTIESYEGVGLTPAYRGLAYVVVEDFPLADFGNRIPNFTFEVKKRMLIADTSGDLIEDMVKGVCMIPGSGEFVYDTIVHSKVYGEQTSGGWVQRGDKVRINQNNRDNKADSLVGVDQLLETCKNVEWVALVVTWFCNSMDLGTCYIKPGIEYTNAITEPNLWQVGSFTRSNAHQITLDSNQKPVYGGTPNDAGVLRLIDYLKSKNLKVLFYPMFFMDTTGKPWRGRLTGTSSQVSDFFTRANGYNAFISHYASLVVGKVDGFVIGSELIGLTKVYTGTTTRTYPAVDALVSLAATVKTTLGASVKITYAADWSEYHHTDDGWYNMDSLWASSNIDVIGIDAYFPLTDEPYFGYDVQKVMDGWTSGEGYDWYYSDPERTIKVNFPDGKFAWKNMNWWWTNTHTNPNSVQTPWVPQSKKIWFTEYGFPSVDGATNQPNVFYDPTSTESTYPRFSKTRVDFGSQRMGLTATEKKWKNSTMIERMFIWTWDARPFPYWPDLLGIWGDGVMWKTGHWIQGKLGASMLAAIVADLSKRVGLVDADFDVSRLYDLVEGFVITSRMSARDAVELLQKGYFFDAVESDGKIKYVKRGSAIAAQILEDDLVHQQNDDNKRELMIITRTQELELPQKVDIIYINRVSDYQTGAQHSQRQTTLSKMLMTKSLPIVYSDQYAKYIADVTLFNAWIGRTKYQFELPIKHLKLEPTDVIQVTVNSLTHTIRIISVLAGKPGILKITGISEDVSVYDFSNRPGEQPPRGGTTTSPGSTQLELLDLPAFPGDADNQGRLYFAAAGTESSWRGAIIYRSNDGGANYEQMVNVVTSATIGRTTTALASGSVTVFDNKNIVTVLLTRGQLQSITQLAVLNGGNAAVIGNEIVQFKTATLVDAYKYTLSGLLRGRLGTEHEIGNHVVGERFVLLNPEILRITMPNNTIGLSRKYKPVSIGNTLGQTGEYDFTFRGNSFKPYSPVNILGWRDPDGSLNMVWLRRARVGGEWRDNIDVPVSEVIERYEIDIMNGVAVVRTIRDIFYAYAIYTADDQILDFGSLQSSINIKIYQISDVVGRGYPAAATL